MTTTTGRTARLKQALTERRRAMQADVDERMRDGRTNRSNEVRDVVDLCDVGIEEELSFALIQMQAETLMRVDAALARLEAGKYGICVECAARIAEGRLRALPFAVRCTGCEERIEETRLRSRQQASREGSALSPEVLGA